MELDGVELLDLHFPTTDPGYLRDLKKLCTDLHLTVSALAVSNDFGPDDRRGQETDKVRNWTDVAGFMGAPVVRVFAGWPPARPPEADPGRIVGLFRRVFGEGEPNLRRIWSDVTWSLRQCADYAAERGVVLALQNNGADGLVGSPEQLQQVLRDVGSPWLRVCLDAAELAARPAFDQSLADVVQVEARLTEVRDDGSDARVHWPELLRILQLGRYRGFIDIAYEGVEDPETAVPRAARYMRGLLHLLERQRLLASPATSENGAGDDAPDTLVTEVETPAAP
jgi:sugar phosphate isomerase/epimerase